MRKSLYDLIDKTIIFQYVLPNESLDIPKTIHTDDSDHCFKLINQYDLSDIIYNGIVDYSYNENKIDLSKIDLLHIRALISKIRYNSTSSTDIKVKYGFYGEILLFLILKHRFKVSTLISRGYFYNPLEKSETKGYDTYQIIQRLNSPPELWFGEVKFYENYKAALVKIFENINKALSSSYLSENIIAMSDRGEFNIVGSDIEDIVRAWEENPLVNIMTELKTRKMTLVYPILLVFDQKEKKYDEIISEVIEHINLTYPAQKYNIEISVNVFFILLPVSNVNQIKRDVISWIDSQKPLI